MLEPFKALNHLHSYCLNGMFLLLVQASFIQFFLYNREFLYTNQPECGSVLTPWRNCLKYLFFSTLCLTKTCICKCLEDILHQAIWKVSLLPESRFIHDLTGLLLGFIGKPNLSRCAYSLEVTFEIFLDTYMSGCVVQRADETRLL